MAALISLLKETTGAITPSELLNPDSAKILSSLFIPTSSESSLTSDSTNNTSRAASFESLTNSFENCNAFIELVPPTVGTNILLPPSPPSLGNLKVIESQLHIFINLLKSSVFFPLLVRG